MSSEYDCRATAVESLRDGYKAKVIFERFKYPKRNTESQTTRIISGQNARLKETH